jgi:hypothetical protein
MGALGVPEQLAFDQRLRQGRAVDGDERTFAPAGPVDGLGIDLLAHAGLATQQQVQIRLRQLPHLLDETRRRG